MTASEWDVFALLPGGDYNAPEYLATLYEAREKSIRVELHGAGSGSFTINRSSPECTEAILAQGNLIKVRIPEIHSDYIFAFFLETGDFTLVSSDEKGGEMLRFGGRGNLVYLANGITWSHTFIGTDVFNKDGLWRAYAEGFGTAPGQLLRLMIDEYQHVDRPQQPIPLLVPDFDYDVDSNGAAWATDDATAEFTVPVGDDGLQTLQRLLDTESITVQMDPDFTLHAYNTLGRNLAGDAFGAGVVRFQRGVNIATELRRELQPSIVATHELIAGESGHYGAAALPGASNRVTREVFNTAFGVITTPLNRLALADLQDRLKQSDTILFPIANRRTADVVLVDPVSIGSALGPVATDGFYLPGPPGSDHGDFWVGDTVRVHTGSEAFDYNEVNAQVQAITITRDDDGKELIVTPELKIIPIPPLIQNYTASYPLGGCLTSKWPIAAPTPGDLEIAFLAQRGNPGNYTTNLISTTSLIAGTCNPLLNIGGTGWTFIDGFDIATGGGWENGNGSPITMCCRDVTSSDKQFTYWGVGDAISQHARTHHVEMAGLSGTPTVTATSHDQSTGGSVFTSPNITVGAAGWIFAGFSYEVSGPSDGSSAYFSMVPRSPAVTLTDGYAGNPANTDFYGPYSWFGYLKVDVAGTYNIVLDRNHTPRRFDSPWGWILAFWPE